MPEASHNPFATCNKVLLASDTLPTPPHKFRGGGGGVACAYPCLKVTGPRLSLELKLGAFPNSVSLDWEVQGVEVWHFGVGDSGGCAT